MHRNLEKLTTCQPMRSDYKERFFPSVTNKTELIERQKEMSRLPKQFNEHENKIVVIYIIY